MASDVTIVPYKPAYATYFKSLNEEWLEKLFAIEEEDVKMLNNPKEVILDNGGAILFAQYEGEIVGCCALKHEGNQVYELIKMAVTETAQGKGIGYLVCKAIIDKAIALGATELYLISHSSLDAAIHLYKKLGFRQVPVTARDQERYERCDYRMIYPPELLK